MELGDKLRQARQEAGLSQRAVCGDVITRNMLSQIEHGSASPSIATLRYLAEKLGRPMGYFFQEEAFVSPNRDLMDRAWEAMEAGKFSEAARILKGYRGPDPVYDRYYGQTNLVVLMHMAEQAVAEQREIFARELLDRARDQEEKLTVSIPGMTRRREELERQLEGEADDLPSLDGPLLLRAERALEAGEVARAAGLLEAVEDRKCEKWKLLKGKCLVKEGKFREAADCLRDAEESRETAPLLEICYRELEDYKMAYFYACKQKEKA